MRTILLVPAALLTPWRTAVPALLVSVSLAVATPRMLQALQQPAAPARRVELADAPGRTEVVRLCSDCHSLEVVTLRRYSPAGWAEVLDEMARQGTVFTDEDYEAVLTYLQVHFGRVNVNAADAADIAAVLELTSDMAARVVEHRETHGRFTSLDDLARVPGLSRQLLTARSDRIAFK